MIDVLLISQRLVLITGYLAELATLAETRQSDFVADKIKSAAAESYLRRSLEAIFDVGRHILAKSGSIDLATEYKAIARGLFQKKVISEDISQELVEMAGYRNRLVHLYHEITDEELYGIIRHNLTDIHQFVKQIRDFINSK